MSVKLRNEQHLESLILKGGRTGSSESTLAKIPHCLKSGAQWLSGRVLDSSPRGRGFEPHRRHCTVVLEQDTFILA